MHSDYEHSFYDERAFELLLAEQGGGRNGAGEERVYRRNGVFARHKPFIPCGVRFLPAVFNPTVRAERQTHRRGYGLLGAVHNDSFLLRARRVRENSIGRNCARLRREPRVHDKHAYRPRSEGNSRIRAHGRGLGLFGSVLGVGYRLEHKRVHSRRIPSAYIREAKPKTVTEQLTIAAKCVIIIEKNKR